TLAIEASVREMLGDLPALAHVIAFDRESGEPADGDGSFSHLLATAHPGDAPLVIPEPKDDAAYIYTSGTTGKPKGVKLTHQAFAFEARAMNEALSVSPADRTVSIFPWAHVGGFCELIIGVQFGASAAL